VRLVCVHDHNMRFVGHHCLIEDRTHEHDLERLLSEISGDKAESPEPESREALTR
jgi:hypothetical protein